MMHRGTHNFFGTVKRSNHALTLVLAFLMATPQPAMAVSKSKLIGNPAFAGLVVAIARLNAAMRSAAENPHDEFRRRNVRTALQAMPPAIVALALVFKSGKLHNADLPMVQAMLGGFVDVNAADNYKKFMQRPDASLIPKVGSELPASMMAVPEDSGNGNRRTLGFDENAARNARTDGSSVGKDPYAQAVDAAPGEYVDRMPASLPVRSSGSGNEPARGFTPEDRAAFVADFNSPAPSSAPIGIARDNSAVVGRSGVVDATRDLLLVEAQQGIAVDRQPASSLDSDLVMKKDSKNRKLNPSNYRLKAGEKFWQFGRLLHQAEALLIHDAHAEECQDCGGGGGGGGGGDAAGILFGIAAIMAAIVPAIVAGIQAGADKDIARTQAEAQKYMTDSTNANSQALAARQQETAITTAQLQAKVAEEANAGVTERLDKQLASLEKARDQAAQAEQQRLALENEYNQQRIALAEKQADQNMQVARATLNAQLTQAGLSQGTSTANSSGMSTTPNSAAGSVAANQVAQSNAGLPGGATGFMGSRLQGSSSSSSSGGGASAESQAFQPMAASTGGQRLLASLDTGSRGGSRAFTTSGPTIDSIDEEPDSDKSRVIRKKGVTTVRGLAPAGSLLAALRDGGRGVVGGSSARGMVSKPVAVASRPASGGGDLAAFLTSASSKADSRGFAGSPEQMGTRHTSSARGLTGSQSSSTAQMGGGHSAAYRAP